MVRAAALIASVVVFVALVLPHQANADAESCRDAVDKYNSAQATVAGALKRYAHCVDESEGRDDCSSEFALLRNAQSDYEDAVGNYLRECGR